MFSGSNRFIITLLELEVFEFKDSGGLDIGIPESALVFFLCSTFSYKLGAVLDVCNFSANVG